MKVLSSLLAVCVTLGQSYPEPQLPRSYNGNDRRIASEWAVMRINRRAAREAFITLVWGTSLIAVIMVTISVIIIIILLPQYQAYLCIYWMTLQYQG